MANLKSSRKDIRRSASRAMHNRSVVSELRTMAKGVAAARASGDGEMAVRVARAYASALDKAVKYGVIHANRANRGKRRLASMVFSQATARV
ncbi:MAG: 30S ribosomal protein S20 [Puniceicoccales bacterium]|jgi:small subunit ribosomal protein S20|nr:30S ribosomal protein S20 [Puniceicoccales bacterium]